MKASPMTPRRLLRLAIALAVTVIPFVAAWLGLNGWPAWPIVAISMACLFVGPVVAASWDAWTARSPQSVPSERKSGA